MYILDWISRFTTSVDALVQLSGRSITFLDRHSFLGYPSNQYPLIILFRLQCTAQHSTTRVQPNPQQGQLCQLPSSCTALRCGTSHMISHAVRPMERLQNPTIQQSNNPTRNYISVLLFSCRSLFFVPQIFSIWNRRPHRLWRIEGRLTAVGARPLQLNRPEVSDSNLMSSNPDTHVHVFRHLMHMHV